MAASYFTQLVDYTDAFRNYIHLATGVSLDRIVFSKPELAKRNLKERQSKNQLFIDGSNTIELDEFISFFFNVSIAGNTDERNNVMQGFTGSLGGATHKPGYVVHQDLSVQIDIFGGPKARGREFVFNNQMLLKEYFRRNRGVFNPFTKSGFNVRDLADPTKKFDVDSYYELILNDVQDYSNLDEQYSLGLLYRTTFDFIWMISLFNIQDMPVDVIREIILEYIEDTGDRTLEFDILTTTTTTTLLDSSVGAYDNLTEGAMGAYDNTDITTTTSTTSTVSTTTL